MRRSACLPALPLLILLLLPVLSCAPPPPRPGGHFSSREHRPPVDAGRLAQKIHALINRERRTQGLAPLAFDEALSRIARDHSRDMARRGYFSHESPDGADFSERYRRAGYVCAVRAGSTIYEGAENIALNNLYASSRSVNGVMSYEWNSEDRIAGTTVEGWMKSPGHRRNILTPHLLREGIGVHIAPDDRVYITQNFC